MFKCLKYVNDKKIRELFLIQANIYKYKLVCSHIYIIFMFCMHNIFENPVLTFQAIWPGMTFQLVRRKNMATAMYLEHYLDSKRL